MHLESLRDGQLQDRVISLQSHCRGFLSRKKLQQRRLQDLAVRCIQRNVRAFLAVRDWPWWRLMVRVAPVLGVVRQEEQLKQKTVNYLFFFSKYYNTNHFIINVGRIGKLEGQIRKIGTRERSS